MANPLDDVTRRDEEEDLSRLPRIVIRPQTLPEGGNGDAPDLVATDNTLTRAVAPANSPIDLMAGIKQLRDYVNRVGEEATSPAGFPNVIPAVGRAVKRVVDFDRESTENIVNAVRTLYENPELAKRVLSGITGISTEHTVPGRTGKPAQSPPVERMQLWPERMVRSGVSLPGQVMSGEVPVTQIDPVTGEAHTSKEVIERAQDTAGLMGGGALVERPSAVGTTLGSGPMRRAASEAPPAPTAQPFYSALEHALVNTEQASAPGAQWLGTLKNSPGVKPEELAWTGVEDWLKGQKGKVSKEDVQRYLDEHKVEIKEVTKKGEPALEDGEYSEHSMNMAEEYASRVMEEDFRRLPPEEQARYQNVDDWIQNSENADALLDRHGDIAYNWLDENGETAGGVNGPRYEAYQLPGGKNYREHLLTLPQRGVETAAEWYARKYPDKSGLDQLPEADRVWMERAYNQEREAADQIYRSSHWDEPNVLAHVRTNERTMQEAAPQFKLRNKLSGNTTKAFDSEAAALAHRETLPETLRPNLEVVRAGDTKNVPTLHIEEIQSDWHQQGRKQGYKRGLKPEDIDLRRVESTVPEGHNPDNYPGYWESYDKDGQLVSRHGGHLTREQALAEAVKDDKISNNQRIPQAPFKTSWPELALKRMIRLAAEEGKDRISWTPGEAQAARYDLSKQVDRVSYDPERQQLRVYKDGRPLSSKNVAPEGLEAEIGKEAASKLLDQPLKADAEIKTDGSPRQTHVLEGLDLKVGGEGMKGFYDKMLPKMVEKLGKAHGVKVKKGDLGSNEYRVAEFGGQFGVLKQDPTGEVAQGLFNTRKAAEDWIKQAPKKAEPIWYFDIPPAWKDQALSKGFPLFMNGIPFPVLRVDGDPFKQEQK